MATRVQGGWVVNGAGTTGHNLSGAALATVLTYTVPAGRQAMLRWANIFFTNLAPTVAFQITTGGVTTTILSTAANANIAPNFPLNAGDTVTVVVTANIAASTFDANIGAEEYLAA